MILKLVVLVLIFLYANFFLGSLPLPPTPSRPFYENGTGLSKFAQFNDVSQQLAVTGKETSLTVAIAVLVLLYVLWVVVNRNNSFRPSAFRRVLGFLFLFFVALVAADYSRELSTESPLDYAQARIEWITRGGSNAYPQWATDTLYSAIQSGSPSDLDRALDAVVAPAYGKIPASPALSETCRTAYRSIFARNPRVATPPSGTAEYGVACEILKAAVPKLASGLAAFSDPRDCLGGAGIKILHALDVHRLSCGLKHVPDAMLSPAVVCPSFVAVIGSRAFDFCKE
jgi:hypothetical protein